MGSALLAAGIPELVNLVIRGGRLFVIIANPGLTDTIRVRVQLCFAKQQQKNSTDTVISNTFQDWAVTVTTGPRPISWSIVDAPDYSEYLYPPVMDKSIDLKPGDDTTMIHKLREEDRLRPVQTRSRLVPILVHFKQPDS